MEKIKQNYISPESENLPEESSENLFEKLPDNINYSSLRESISEDPELLIYYSSAKLMLQEKNPGVVLTRPLVFKQMLEMLSDQASGAKEKNLHKKLKILMIKYEQGEYGKESEPVKFDLENIDFNSLRAAIESDAVEPELYKIYKDAKKICIEGKKSVKRSEVVMKMNEILNEDRDSIPGQHLMSQFRILLENHRR